MGEILLPLLFVDPLISGGPEAVTCNAALPAAINIIGLHLCRDATRSPPMWEVTSDMDLNTYALRPWPKFIFCSAAPSVVEQSWRAKWFLFVLSW